MQEDNSSEEENGSGDETVDAQFEEQLRIFSIRLSHINDKIDSSKRRLKPNVSEKWLTKIKRRVTH